MRRAGGGPGFRLGPFFLFLAVAGGIVLCVVGGVSLIGAEPENAVGGALVLPLGVLGTVLLVRRWVEPRDHEFVVRVLVAGLLLRVGLTLVAHVHLPVGFFAPDQYTYQDAGWRTLLWLRGEGPRPAQIQGVEVGYFYWNAALYSVFGFAPLVPKVINAFIGGWTGLVAYRIGGELAGQQVARRSAALVLFFPSLILWSTQNLRDPATVFVLGLILLHALRLQVRPSGRKLLRLVALLAVLMVLRDYLAVMTVFALVGSFLITPGRQLAVNVVLALALLAAAALAYQQLGLGDEFIRVASFEAVAAQREALAIGGTAFNPDANVAEPLQGLLYLPIGLSFFLFAPFPWQFGSLLSLMTLPEMVVWYALLPAVAYGGWFLIRERFRRVEPILLFLLVTAVIYGLVEGNAGTAYRHRAQLLLFFLVFAATGLELRARKRRGRRGRA